MFRPTSRVTTTRITARYTYTYHEHVVSSTDNATDGTTSIPSIERSACRLSTTRTRPDHGCARHRDGHDAHVTMVHASARATHRTAIDRGALPSGGQVEKYTLLACVIFASCTAALNGCQPSSMHQPCTPSKVHPRRGASTLLGPPTPSLSLCFLVLTRAAAADDPRKRLTTSCIAHSQLSHLAPRPVPVVVVGRVHLLA